jgi:hypothetical protein
MNKGSVTLCNYLAAQGIEIDPSRAAALGQLIVEATSANAAHTQRRPVRAVSSVGAQRIKII